MPARTGFTAGNGFIYIFEIFPILCANVPLSRTTALAFVFAQKRERPLEEEEGGVTFSCLSRDILFFGQHFVSSNRIYIDSRVIRVLSRVFGALL